MHGMALALHGAFFITTKRGPRPATKPAARDDIQAERDDRLFCAHCRNAVTHEDQRIGVSGAHTHTCTNPSGLVFHIGCFREAPGCAATGEATAQHSWFAGYGWKVTVCTRCGVQLGWHFLGDADTFYGLILDRLAQ